MAQRRMVKVDAKKLEEIREKSGMSPKQFADDLGHSSSWYHHATRYEQTMAKSDAISIQLKYGIDIELKEEKKQEEAESGESTETNQWLCEIAEKLDGMRSDEILARLNEMVSSINALIAVQKQVVELMQDEEKAARPKAFVRKGKENREYRVDRDSFVVTT